MSAQPHTANLLLIAGSPHRGGVSDALLDAAAEGARDAGASITRIVASSAGVEACRGCRGCDRNGQCVVRDGMGAIYQSLDAADALVIAAPVYFAGVPAVLKALYDRMQPYWVRRYVLGEPARPKRPAALLLAGGGGDPYGSGCAVTTTRSALAVTGFSVADADVLEAIADEGPAGEPVREAALVRARALGADLVAAARR